MIWHLVRMDLLTHRRPAGLLLKPVHLSGEPQPAYRWRDLEEASSRDVDNQPRQPAPSSYGGSPTIPSLPDWESVYALRRLSTARRSILPVRTEYRDEGLRRRMSFDDATGLRFTAVTPENRPEEINITPRRQPGWAFQEGQPRTETSLKP